MKFYKYQALGNDYLILDPQDQPIELTPERIRIICHRNYGIGSDGILLGPLLSPEAPFGLRIFNPDGSEAEKSGNGLRIFSRYLWDRKLVEKHPFTIETKGGLVRCLVLDEGKRVQVEMGRVSFWSPDIPITGEPREVLQEPITVADKTFRFSGATIGNPHCVIPVEDLSPELAKSYGPLLENHPLFPNRTNVQFIKVLDRNSIRIEIWERGAGNTLASGSSGSAAAAVANKLGLCDSPVTVHMPGGQLHISIDKNFAITMTGPVTRIAEGQLAEEMFQEVI
ncbi:MAG: diaminopimelate epimerase [Deltaproteobacteria bacterium]|nr:diaminopimelate epimerase [Deltaproteobacteria bacterium]